MSKIVWKFKQKHLKIEPSEPRVEFKTKVVSLDTKTSKGSTEHYHDFYLDVLYSDELPVLFSDKTIVEYPYDIKLDFVRFSSGTKVLYSDGTPVPVWDYTIPQGEIPAGPGDTQLSDNSRLQYSDLQGVTYA